MTRILFFFAVLFVCFKANSAIIYVNVNATGANNGSSWADAYTDLQTALSVAFINDDIWVATGIYKPTATTSRSISFVMRNGIDMYGGFAGTETAVGQRNIALNPTTLSGDIGALGDNTDNTYRVVKVENFTASFTFDGFRIVSGYNATASSNGAGMFVSDCPGPLITIRNTVFYNNYVDSEGAGIYLNNTNIDFYNCEFLYNSTSTSGIGGAVYTDLAGINNLQFYDTKFIGNYARSGVVTFFRSSGVLLFERTLVTNNTTSNLSSSGSIIYVDPDADHFAMNNSLVAGNQIYSNSGGVFYILISTVNACELNNVTICHNKNLYPAAPSTEMVYHSTNFNTTMAINNCIVYGNTPSDVGAQINADVNAVHNSIVEGGYVGGINVITTNPGFVNPGTLASAPFDATTYDYSLLVTSPGVNYGNNQYALPFSVDYLGNTRIQQINVDCGAIESPFADVIPPVADCASNTVYLDVNGMVVIDSADVNGNSSDNVGIVSMTISETTFDCTDIGPNPVTLIVTDASGNADTCTATITVADAMPPAISAQNLSVYLGVAGNVAITADDMDTGTTDNCGMDTIYVSQTSFDCSDTGPNTITFTAVDIHGNTSSVTRTVTVIDSVDPTVLTQNVTVYLNANGNVGVTSAQINNGSYDDCTIAGLTVSPNSFNCNSLGANIVTLSAIDGYGNLSTATATVTVLDTITPVTIGQDITVNLVVSNPYIITPANLNNGSDDNCSFTQTIDMNSFNAVGVYDVELTTTDASGNSSSGVYQVTVINSGVGLDEADGQISLVYPNPTSGAIHVVLSGTIDYLEARLLDVTGKVVTEASFTQTTTFDLTIDGVPGFYMLEIGTPGKTWTQTKILKH